MLKYLFASLILCISSFFVSAQEKEVSIQFISFPISNQSAPIDLLIGDGKSISVELPTSSLSPIYKVPAMSQWSLGKMNVTDDDKKVFKSLGTVKAIASSNQLIIVLRKGETYKDGLEMIPINYDLEKFGGGQYLMMNMTKVDIGVELGTTLAALKPNKPQLVKPKVNEAAKTKKQLATRIYFRKGDKVKPFYSSSWRLNYKARTLVLFYHDPNNQRIRTHTIRNFIP